MCQNASFTLFGVESDGDDDGFGGHIFAVFDAAKIVRGCAGLWQSGVGSSFSTPQERVKGLGGGDVGGEGDAIREKIGNVQGTKDEMR